MEARKLTRNRTWDRSQRSTLTTETLWKIEGGALEAEPLIKFYLIMDSQEGVICHFPCFTNEDMWVREPRFHPSLTCLTVMWRLSHPCGTAGEMEAESGEKGTVYCHGVKWCICQILDTLLSFQTVSAEYATHTMLSLCLQSVWTHINCQWMFWKG
jgi:hypothetical protein